jgi:hypothetical protein
MKKNEGVRRIVITIRALGVLALALGAVGLQCAGPSAQLAVGILMIVVAMPFFVVAWIIDGFATSGEREVRALQEEWRRNSRLGRGAEDRRAR